MQLTRWDYLSPKDISLVGFDDMGIVAHLDVPRVWHADAQDHSSENKCQVSG